MPFPSSDLYPGSDTFPGYDDDESDLSDFLDANDSESSDVLDANDSDSLIIDANDAPVIPPVGEVGRLRWDNIKDRQVETGIDRGVIYLNDGRSVAWVGLTGVDETGGESAVEYYIDGRPFLFFPKPKEFKATIKAYTYPDAFGEILGEVEITDGMYLDSQVGDSFGLSYRTKIANSINGIEAAYKIHLIYNAFIIPSSKSYETIGSDINPVEFEWELKAVPIRVDGYRETAHITIDTRHMDATRIEEIESLLYGTDDLIPSLPTAQTIFDLLNFGDAITITDNGDGTWSAEGSYHNIYMLDKNTFQIENANAVEHIDGTYTISSTP